MVAIFFRNGSGYIVVVHMLRYTYKIQVHVRVRKHCNEGHKESGNRPIVNENDDIEHGKKFKQKNRRKIQRKKTKKR